MFSPRKLQAIQVLAAVRVFEATGTAASSSPLELDGHSKSLSQILN